MYRCVSVHVRAEQSTCVVTYKVWIAACHRWLATISETVYRLALNL